MLNDAFRIAEYSLCQVETRIFTLKLEYSSGNSNMQVETRISSVFKKKGDFHGMYFPEGLIEYQVETRIFKWKLEYSSGNSNIQVEN